MQCLIMGFSDNRVWLQVAKKTYYFPFRIGSSGASFLSVGCSPVLWWFALVWDVLLFVFFFGHLTFFKKHLLLLLLLQSSSVYRV